MSGFPAGHTLTIVRLGAVTGRDQYGNDIRAPSIETLVPGCAVAPSFSAEDVQGRDQVTDDETAWFPAGTDIRPTDRVRLGGQLYDVDGTSSAWASPFTGRSSPVQVTLKRVTG